MDPLFFPLDGQTKGGVVVGTTGKKASTLEIVHIDYNIFEDMKKKIVNISIFELSKISSQQELILKDWKDDKEYSVE